MDASPVRLVRGLSFYSYTLMLEDLLKCMLWVGTGVCTTAYLALSHETIRIEVPVLVAIGSEPFPFVIVVFCAGCSFVIGLR